MTLVVILTVRAEALERFRAFEMKAAQVMGRYGGAIERVVVIPADAATGLMKEVHVVTFPDAGALEAYRQDPELAAAAHLRDGAVVSTEILVGEDGPDYHALSR